MSDSSSSSSTSTLSSVSSSTSPPDWPPEMLLSRQGELMIRKRSRRIARLSYWKNSRRVPRSSNSSHDYPITVPLHSELLQLYYSTWDATTRLDSAIDICKAHYKEMAFRDYSFILEVILDGSTNQGQFWESMATLIRGSLHPTGLGPQRQEWRELIASVLLEVFLKRDQSVFVKQVERLRNRESSSQEPLEPFGSEHVVLAHTMIDSLSLKFQTDKALGLYTALSEHGIAMHPSLFESLIRIVTTYKDASQLEMIGNILLKHENVYQESISSTSTASRPYNRPLLMPPKLMDAFVHAAFENEQYDLARSVFDKGLEAGCKYRTSTFTAILNSHSVEVLGFDMNSVVKGMEWYLGTSNSSGWDDNRGTTVSLNDFLVKDPAVATPKEVEKYISAMERQGLNPTIQTLNVLVKLYLEMALYNVVDAPSWTAAFTRYNPQGLEPDVVTHNTVLAYYGKRRDLATMKRIYDDMTGVHESPSDSRRSRKSRRKKQIEQSQSADGYLDHVNHTTEYIHEEQEEPLVDSTEMRMDQRQDERLQSALALRSDRDIYTYNTMIHALLQHAVKTKDIVTIGQCFHDMEQDGIPVDTVTFNTNILYHISRKDLTAAMQVFNSMRNATTGPDTINSDKDQSSDHTSLQSDDDSALTKSGSKPTRSTPSSVFAKAARTALEPNNAGKHQPLDRSNAVTTTASTPDTPPAPDIVTLTSLISGLGQTGQMHTVTQIFRDMTNRLRIEPNIKTYSALATGLHCAGDHRRAKMLWDIVLSEKSNRTRSNATIKKDSSQDANARLDGVKESSERLRDTSNRK
ncbi:hypothetical protein BGX31_011586 [Mortierella sp. GBA43]|nr:hypothetical protein BGX31_011586 [Mortierella sp. GBA43]